MMNNVISELNIANKTDLKRHLLFTSGKITNLIMAEKENINFSNTMLNDNNKIV